jgi:phosphopantothenoylcysteine synthetase/decarboxylase
VTHFSAAAVRSWIEKEKEKEKEKKAMETFS